MASFCDSFNEAINKNSSLSNVEKTNYLLNLVTDDALATIKGLQLSDSSYQTALDLLNERYNDPQITISIHM